MRSGRRPDLDDVRTQFEAWRAGPRARVIPDRLWLAACELLDRHATSKICRQLRLNASRFIERRKTIGGGRADELMRKRMTRGAQEPRRRSTALRRQAPACDPNHVDSSRETFLELPPVALKLPPGASQVAPLTARRNTAECRVVLETRVGVRLTVVLPEVDHVLIEALYRRVVDQ